MSMNSASRLNLIFVRLRGRNGAPSIREFASAVGLSDASRSAVLKFFNDLEIEFALIQEAIETFDSPRRQLYAEGVPRIRRTIESFSLVNGEVNYVIDEMATSVLGFMATDLPSTEDGTDQINEIRRLIQDLQTELEKSDLPSTIRIWMLDLTRVLRDSLDRYIARGGRGLKSEIARILGELQLNWDVAQQVEKESPSVWTKFLRAFDALVHVATYTEKLQKGLEAAHKLLPFLQRLGLPGPDNNP